MSEFSSLYVKVSIFKAKLEQFFQQKPMPKSLNDNWSAWWDNREMYDKNLV